jgi:hypothetical protein
MGRALTPDHLSELSAAVRNLIAHFGAEYD